MNPLTFVRGVGSVAIKYGVEEAILLDTIVFWARENKSRGENFKDGRWWTYNSIKGLAEIFPWWSQKQLRRILNSCIEQKALLVGNYNREKRDRTIWYSPSNDLLLIYGEDWTGKCICPNGQMEMPERADGDAQTGTPLPCLNPCSNSMNTPHSPPEGGKGKNSRTSKYDLAEDAKPILRAYVGEDRELGLAIAALVEVRIAKKAVNSARAISMLLCELDKLSQGCREDKLLILRQSVTNSWKGVFPLKGRPPAQPSDEDGGKTWVAREKVATW